MGPSNSLLCFLLVEMLGQVRKSAIGILVCLNFGGLMVDTPLLEAMADCYGHIERKIRYC